MKIGMQAHTLFHAHGFGFFISETILQCCHVISFGLDRTQSSLAISSLLLRQL